MAVNAVSRTNHFASAAGRTGRSFKGNFVPGKTSQPINAGIETQFSPTEAVIGLRELAQAGYNAQESIKLLLPVLDLAAGSLGELTPQAAAGLAAQAMKAFGISLDDASSSVDRMLQAVNVFALNASELPLALGTASRGAQTLNQSLRKHSSLLAW
jgi:TP901 family phage tail tape measure protein